MIKLRVIAVSKDKDPWLTQGVSHYEKLLKKWASLEWVLLTSDTAASLSPPEIVRREAAAILDRWQDSFHIALSDRGQSFDSVQLAHQMQSWLVYERAPLTFVVGGPYGLSTEVLERADTVLSLSPLTFSHQVVRLVLLEQLYRALSIIHGTDYHK